MRKIPLISHWGQLGVGIFFIISAYYLYYPNNTSIEFVVYIKKKMLRIWPVYFVAITLTFVFSFLIGYSGYERTILDYLLNIVFINGYIGKSYIDGAHWYLTALISFIFVIGVFRKFNIDKNINSYIVWLVLACIFKGFSVLLGNESLLSLVLSGMYKLLGGAFIGYACIGVLLHMWMEKCGWKRYNALVLIGLSVFYTLAATNVWRVLSMGISVIIVMLCICEKMLFLNNRILVFLGTVSYSFFLCHQEIGYFLENVLINQKCKYPICVLVAWVCVFGISILLYLFEQKVRGFYEC